MSRVRYSTDEFIINAMKVHNGKYIYFKTNYIHSQEKIIVTCPTHGDFLIRPALHLANRGCPVCGKKILDPNSVLACLLKDL